MPHLQQYRFIVCHFMTKLPAYLFLTIGLLAILFFMSYSGTEIPNKELWIVFSIFFIIIGGFLIAKQKIEALRQTILRDNPSSLNDNLIKTGEKIRVTLDKLWNKKPFFSTRNIGWQFSNQDTTTWWVIWWQQKLPDRRNPTDLYSFYKTISRQDL